MKVIHQKVEAYPDKIKLPVDYLKISDPMYGENVWCRYEKDNLQMDSIQVMVNHETVYDERYDENTDYGELIVSLSNHHAKGDPTLIKEYQIGVDSASYTFQTEHALTDIYTAADGLFGVVKESYYEDNLGMIDICLDVPDSYSEQEFTSSVLRTMGIYQLHLQVIHDEDVDIEINNEEALDNMVMSP